MGREKTSDSAALEIGGGLVASSSDIKCSLLLLLLLLHLKLWTNMYMQK